VDASKIKVEVDIGNVALTGSVPSWHTREEVYNTALYTTGVVHIEDLLNVRAP